MSSSHSVRKTCAGIVAAVTGYALLRRQGLRGGATEEEARRPLPGDEIIQDPLVQTTHGVTIEAPPAAIWPWLLQAGYRGSGRAGWYTDSPLDVVMEGAVFRLLVPSRVLPERPGRRSADRILPEHQSLKVGDVVPDGPPGSAWFVVKSVDPARSLVLYSDSHTRYLVPTFLHGTRLASRGDFTWVFVLEPVDAHRTRVLLRTRGRLAPRYLIAFAPVFYLAEAIFPRQILRGLKRRAEGRCGAGGVERPAESPAAAHGPS